MVRSTLIFGLLAGCAKTADTAEDVDLLTRLTSRGPYGIGYRTGEVVYPDPDPGAPGDRSLRLALWYPSDATSGTSVDRYDSVFPAEEDVWADAPVAAGGALPVLVFSHGSQAYAEAAAFLMSHFASHGWLVIAPDHTDNTTFDLEDRTTPIYLQRPHDISAALDHVDALPASDPLAGRMGAPIVAAGHSFGGYTVHALAGAAFDVDGACAEDPRSAFCDEMTPDIEALLNAGLADPRVDAIMTLASGDLDKYGEAGIAQIDRPLLHMTASLDDPAGNDELWAALRQTPAPLRVDIAGGGHNMFTDFSGTIDSDGELIDPEVGWRIVRAYTLAFGELQRGDASVAPVLDGSLEVAPEAALVP